MSDAPDGPFYISDDSKHPEKYHTDPDCRGVINTPTVKLADEPDEQQPCVWCADGVRPRDLIEIGTRARGGADE